MLGFKLNTINMSSQIFTHQSEKNGIQQTYSKMPANYNKKFKYNYKKTTNFLNFPKKQRNHTVDLEYQHIEQESNLKTIQKPRNYSQKQKIQKPKTHSSRNYVNNFIFNSNKLSRKTGNDYSQQKKGGSISKNKTERKMHKQTIDGEITQQVPQVEGQTLIIDTQHQIIQTIKKYRTSLPNNQKQLASSRTNIYEKMRSRAIPKTKYTNSIIQSYKIKSIQLVSPFGNKVTIKKGSVSTYPYYLDLAHCQNQKEIKFDEIQQIQLQKVKYDSRRTFSNNHCKQRPVTSKPKIEDFQPKPWQSDERQGLYLKDSISYI